MSFDDYARNWDTEKRIHRSRIVANEIIKFIDINNNLNAMEFGCGTGLVSFNINDKFKTITLIDSSKGMIEILKSKIEKYKITNMFPHEIDICDENFLNMKYDIIYNSLVLHHIYDTEDIIKKFYELLSKNGQLCIVDVDEEDGSFHRKYPEFDGHNGFNQDELMKILIAAGFKEVESKTFYNGEKTVNGELIKYSLFIIKGKK